MRECSQARTLKKLKFAEIHILELRNYIHATSNDDWENAHQESSFYHLAGAVEAMLHEINDAYMLGISLDKVSWNKVEGALLKGRKVSPAFVYLNALRGDSDSWVSQLFEWRNHGTHRRQVNKIVNASNVEPLDNEFLDPRKGQVQTVYPGLRCQAVLERLSEDIKDLILHCRATDPLL